MINVIAVDSLRTIPLTAKLGLSVVFYYLLAAVIFFIPVALVAAELATAYPATGGIYVWVREAFGRRVGFITIWLQWIYNVVWYPTIMAFIAGTMAYLFSAKLASDKSYLLLCSIVLFWIFTLLNCLGMRIANWVSTFGACIGTLLPMTGIIIMGCLWVFHGHPLAVDIHSPIIPSFSDWGNFSLFSVVLFGLLGVEMSAVHAEEVKDPQKDYPRALFYSTLIIVSTLTLSSLAIVLVIPNNTLSLVSGFIDAFAIFFQAYHLAWLTPVMALFIIIGSLSCVSAWIIGPTKGLMVAANDNCLPHKLAKMNRFGAPYKILIIQAILFTSLSSAFIIFDSINAAYWLLSDLCAQLALIVYLFMFAAAIKLRYLHPTHRGAYRIPLGITGLWITATVGFLCCLSTVILGFIPPTQIPINYLVFYESFLIGGIILFILVPWMLSRKITAK